MLYFAPYQVPRFVARATKQQSTDLTSTYKLGAGLLAFPLWAAAACTIAALFVPGKTALEPLLACLVVLTSPFAALAWLDRLPRLSDTFGLLLGNGRGRLPQLRELRRRALDALERGRQQTSPTPP